MTEDNVCSIADGNQTGDPTVIYKQLKVGQVAQRDNRTGLAHIKKPRKGRHEGTQNYAEVSN
jgi:hypothetical protein